jgi:prepilin-type N-terminal cleavage/methylation domain-containing protein
MTGPARCEARAGFSLIEVALALLVAGVGMLSVFALFPAALDMNKKAIDDSQTSLFAQEVFNGFRSAPVTFSQLPTHKVPCTAPSVWKNWASLWVGAGSAANVYEFSDAPIVDFAVRYNMTFGAVPTDPNLLYMRIELLNGQEGPTANPAIFYTEIYNTDVAW